MSIVRCALCGDPIRTAHAICLNCNHAGNCERDSVTVPREQAERTLDALQRAERWISREHGSKKCRVAWDGKRYGWLHGDDCWWSLAIADLRAVLG